MRQGIMPMLAVVSVDKPVSRSQTPEGKTRELRSFVSKLSRIVECKDMLRSEVRQASKWTSLYPVKDA